MRVQLGINKCTGKAVSQVIHTLYDDQFLWPQRPRERGGGLIGAALDALLAKRR